DRTAVPRHWVRGRRPRAHLAPAAAAGDRGLRRRVRRRRGRRRDRPTGGDELAVIGGQDPKRSVLAALAANAAIAVAKTVAGVISGSTAMLAEALHSLADTGNQILLLVGLKRSRRPPDAQYPFGHGRERYVWTLLVAVNIFTLGAAFSVYNGVHGL